MDSNIKYPYMGKVPKNMRIFYGSTQQGLKVIKPTKSKDYPEKGNVIFASLYKPYAACFCLDFDDDTARIGIANNDYTDVSLWLINNIDFTTPCSLYELVNDGSFTVLNEDKGLVWTNKPIKVYKEIEFNSFYEVVKICNIDIYNYNTRMPINNYLGVLSEDVSDHVDIGHVKKQSNNIKHIVNQMYNETKEQTDKAEELRTGNDAIFYPLITATIDSKKELNKRYNQYKSLSKKFKLRCNDKSIEIYGKTMETRYDEYSRILDMVENIEKPQIEPNVLQNDLAINHTLKEHLDYVSSIIKSNTNNEEKAKLLLDLKNSENEFTFTESVLVNRFIKNSIEIIDSSRNLVPYYTPEEMIKLGIFNNSNNNFYNCESTMENLDWFLEYSLTKKVNFRDWYKLLESQYIDLLKDPSDINRQRILELGWNPEIEPSISNIQNANKIKFNEIKANNIESFHEYKKIEKDLSPVFIITTFTNTIPGQLITKFTDCIYSHAGISLESKLDRIFSFNLGSKERPGGGFSLESLSSYVSDNKDGIMKLSCIFVKKEDISKIKFALDKTLANVKNSRYSIANIINIIINRAVDTKDDLSMICSQFVDHVLKTADIDITHKSSNLVTPADFAKNTSDRLYTLYEGKIIEYKESKINKIIESLKNKAVYIKEFNIDESDEISSILESYIYQDIVLEYKTFPSVEFTKDGDMLIKNYKKIDFEEEYYKSVKLLKVYSKQDNYEAMAYELSKLWFMNKLLEQKIYSNNNSKKLDEYNLIRGKILNTFNRYLNILCKNMKEFNFEEYYSNTPFSDTISIKKNTIDRMIDIGKRVIL